MKGSLALFIATFAILGAHRAAAQETAPGPGTVEVTIIPGGGTFFTSKNGAPKFGDYTLGGIVTYNINRVIDIEGEVGGGVGVAQDLAFGGTTSKVLGHDNDHSVRVAVVLADTTRIHPACPECTLQGPEKPPVSQGHGRGHRFLRPWEALGVRDPSRGDREVTRAGARGR